MMRPNGLLARLVGSGSLPSGVRDAVSELIVVNRALVQIEATLREARCTRIAGTELRDLVGRLGPRIRDLYALRSELVERISAGWSASLIAPPRDVILQGPGPTATGGALCRCR